jgi:hypothetical protein
MIVSAMLCIGMNNTGDTLHNGFAGVFVFASIAGQHPCGELKL